MADPDAGQSASPPVARGPGGLPADMPAWMSWPIRSIDTSNRFIGRLVSWLVVPLMIAMVYEVVVRKTLTPTIWAYDISRMLYGALFMLGAAYGLSRGVHIRSDFLYRSWPVRRQGLVDALLYIVLYFPTMIVFLWVSYAYAFKSVVEYERGMETAWMPYLGPIKSCIPLAALLLVIQGISELLKSLYAARTGRWPTESGSTET
ncbi:MAG TPA: TRAP transporter small permease subunit [Hyphomicrobiaceae bacterium]|nr:TRAP transporter small permease subunit [Hyphomicrobiaceae bacterium]